MNTRKPLMDTWKPRDEYPNARDEIAEQRFDNMDNGLLIDTPSEWLDLWADSVENSPFYNAGQGYKVLDACAELTEPSLEIPHEYRSLQRLL